MRHSVVLALFLCLLIAATHYRRNDNTLLSVCKKALLSLYSISYPILHDYILTFKQKSCIIDVFKMKNGSNIPLKKCNRKKCRCKGI